MKRFRMFAACILALTLLAALVPVGASASGKSMPTSPELGYQATPIFHIPCGFSPVPFFDDNLVITQTETLTLTFDIAGEGHATWWVHNWGDHWQAIADASCGMCTLTVTGVTPGMYQSGQFFLTAGADLCPSGGMDIGNFHLTITPDVAAH
jgi:hypothetical protein